MLSGMTFAIPRASNAFEACLNWVSRINVYHPTRLKLSALRSPSYPRKQSPLLLLSLPFFKDKPQRNDPDAVDELIQIKRNPLPIPDASTLSSEHLVRNSASIAGEDAGNLLALALQRVHARWRDVDWGINTRPYTLYTRYGMSKNPV